MLIRPILKRTVDPTDYPVTATEIKLQCRVDHSAQDDLLTMVKLAAVAYVENATNRAIMPQTWRAYWPCFPYDNFLAIPRCPVTAITHLKYTASDATVTTWASSNYVTDLQREPARVLLTYGNIWPAVVLRPGLAVEVEFTAGYANAAAVPPPIKHAILLLCEAWYRNPSAIVTGNNASADSKPLALGVDALLAAYRIPAF